MKQTPRSEDPNLPRNLSGVQFKYTAPSRKGFFAYHQIQAIAPNDTFMEEGKRKPTLVGTLQWHPKTGDVNWVRTDPKYRGLGVATTLWERAHKLAADTGIRAPKHSKHRTEEGEAWAKQVGGDMPKRAPYEEW